MKRNGKFRMVLAVVCIFMLLLSNVVNALPYNTSTVTAGSSLCQSSINNKKINGWHSSGINSWYYYEQGVIKIGWLNDKGNWYYLNNKNDGIEGLMKYGWYLDRTGKWYFLNTKHDGTFGKMLIGWQWIEGYCYCFNNDGTLYQSAVTPDGHTVDKNGRWIKDSTVQYIEGKGLSSKPSFNVGQPRNSDKSYANLDSKTKFDRDNKDSSDKENSGGTGKEEKKYTITFDFNDENQTETKSVSVKEGNYASEIQTPQREGYYFLSWYRNKDEQDLTKAFSFENTPINEDMTLYAIWLDIQNDSDGDGLIDGTEVLIKTDIYKQDTDDDGLTDYQEYHLTATNPLKAYTYSKDIIDADIDIDNDGLSNRQEVEFGSNPVWEDVDKDYLNDGQEKEYGTDPNISDTDKDGLIDGLEIQYGFNPTIPDTDGNGVLDGEEIISITKTYEGTEGNSKPSALITLKSGNADHISIGRDTPSESTWIPEEVPGLLDAAYDFEADGEIEEAVLTFHFDEKHTPSEDFEPAIYYVDTENQELVLLEEQSIDWGNHTITAKTKHFSKYVLLNVKEQEKAWKQEILSSGNIGTNARIEVAFVIDESGSMSTNDRNKVRVDVTKKFIDMLRSGDKAAIIGFDSSSTTYQSLTDNLESAKQSLSNIRNDRGGTNLSAGLEQAMKQYPVAGSDSGQKEQAMKIIVLLTDGQGAYNEKYEQMAIERGIKIYTVGLGTYYDKALLTKISGHTGGKHYHADNADKLIEEFKKLTRDTVDVINDTDKDGLSDYHEERIRLFNGVVILLNKNKADTDSDGLKDGEEIVQRTDKKGRVFFELHSYPNRKDSDRDGIGDKEDEYPLIPKVYKIDCLGSPKHLESLEKRMNKKVNENILLMNQNNTLMMIGLWGIDFLMEDYDTFLRERKVDTTNKFREDYWKSDWDKHWNEYCSKFDSYVSMRGGVDQKIHYFRNNLNRIPKNVSALNLKSSNWVLLRVDSSTYHMCPSKFSGNGLYNLKFISKDGRNEGVYISTYGTKNKNSNKGKACTEKTDPKNMGTYNFSGMYYKDGKASISGLNHLLYDVWPYEDYGNVSKDDLPKEGEKHGENKNRYDYDLDAQKARVDFEKEWGGIRE